MTLLEAINPLDAIEQAIAESLEPNPDADMTNDKPAIWEMIVSTGVDAADKGDYSRWMIGDLAQLAQKKYGEDVIGKFAKEIKVEVKRAEEYRTVCQFWDRKKSARAEIRETCPNIYYSHFREAMRLKNHDCAVRLLHKASGRDWSVERTRFFVNRVLGKSTSPKKLVDLELEIDRLDRCRLTFDLPAAAAEKLIDHAYENRPVRVVIYEVKE